MEQFQNGTLGFGLFQFRKQTISATHFRPIGDVLCNLFLELKPAIRYPLDLSMGLTALDIARLPGRNGTVVAKLTGKLNMETVGGFLKELRAVEGKKLVLDMRDLGFVDSAGVGALVQLFVHCRGKSQELALARLNPQGMAVMQVAGLNRLLPHFPTLEEACE